MKFYAHWILYHNRRKTAQSIDVHGDQRQTKLSYAEDNDGCLSMYRWISLRFPNVEKIFIEKNAANDVSLLHDNAESHVLGITVNKNTHNEISL